MTKIQKYSRKLGFGILGRDTCTFYACTFAAKAQKYKSTKSTKSTKLIPAKMGPKHISLSIAPFYKIRSPYDAQSNSASIHVLSFKYRRDSTETTVQSRYGNQGVNPT